MLSDVVNFQTSVAPVHSLQLHCIVLPEHLHKRKCRWLVWLIKGNLSYCPYIHTFLNTKVILVSLGAIISWILQMNKRLPFAVSWTEGYRKLLKWKRLGLN